LLWGNVKKGWSCWLPGNPSIKEGTYALVVVVGATVAGVILILPFVDWDGNNNDFYHYAALTDWFTLIWLISATYIYHARQLRRIHVRQSLKRPTTQPVTRQPNQAKVVDVDEIDVELNKLRAQLGLQRMKPPKQVDAKPPKH